MERGALLWPAAIVAWVPGYASAAHRHHCVQLILPLRGTIRMGGSQPDWTEVHGVLIRPDALHEVDSSDTPALIAFVDAGSEVGAALMQKFEDDVSVIDLGTVSTWRTQLGDPLPLEQAAVDTWLRTDSWCHANRQLSIPRSMGCCPTFARRSWIAANCRSAAWPAARVCRPRR